MQRIVLKNFGAVENADINIGKILILIGEQASGKSTIAKLIYFFNSLRDDLFGTLYNNFEKAFSWQDYIIPVRDKFYDLFGSTKHLSDFSIIFYYSVENNKSLELSLDAKKSLNVQFSDKFFMPQAIKTINGIRTLMREGARKTKIHEQLAYEQEKLKHARTLMTLVSEMFESRQEESLFVIAGRNATVGYSEFFEKNLFASVQNAIKENSGHNPVNDTTLKRTRQTIDETLMLRFMEKVVKLKDLFKKFGGFEGLMDIYADKIVKDKLAKVCEKIEIILKGKYHIDAWGEKIVLGQDSADYIYLSNASSGQQESIRILQDIFMNVLDNNRVLRILEEPEAHLFPVAQKHMIELLVLMTNNNPENQLIVTTHSPYVLTVFNNLLFANRVVSINPDAESAVSKIIQSEYWIGMDDLAAYSLSKTPGNAKSKGTSIISNETKLIEQNYLDDVSDMLGGDFNALYKIHAKSFERR